MPLPTSPPLPWFSAFPKLLAAAFLIACSGTGNRPGSADRAAALAGKKLAIFPLDTTTVRADPPEDVLEGLPDDGGSLSPSRILAIQFLDRFHRSLARELPGSAVKILPADSAPDTSVSFSLRIANLEARRQASSTLVPKIGTVVQHTLYLIGEYEVREVRGNGDPAPGRSVAAGRFRVFVTTSRNVDAKEWRKAFDEAARQVADAPPFGTSKR